MGKTKASSSGILFAGPIDDLQTTLAAVTTSGYDFLAVSLAKTTRCREKCDDTADGVSDARKVQISSSQSASKSAAVDGSCIARWSDVALSSNDWSFRIVGVVSTAPLITDVADAAQRYPTVLEADVSSQLDLAIHLSLSATTVPLERAEDVVTLAHVISMHLAHNSHIRRIWMRVPITSGREKASSESPWHWWHRFRCLIDYDPRVGVALDLTSPSSRAASTGEVSEASLYAEAARWHGEPVKSLVVSEAAFQMNSKGFPVLDRVMKHVMRSFFKLNVQFVVEVARLAVHADDATGDVACSQAVVNYHAFIEHLWTTYWTVKDCGKAVVTTNRSNNVHNGSTTTSARVDGYDEAEAQRSVAYRQFTSGYEDYLQMPLQPLMDNLESVTYEVFERDPVKYELYGTAITDALRDVQQAYREAAATAASLRNREDRAQTNGNGHGDDNNNDAPIQTVNVMVLGAGRGPLVQAVINAAAVVASEDESLQLAFRLRIFAVEKNEHAVNTLHVKMDADWVGANVTVVSGDMRDWRPDVADRAHVVISELLGSFGDNELSPECLYAAEHLLAKRDIARDGGLTPISIPASYCSYVAPVQSAKLYGEVRGAMADFDGSPLAKVGRFEMPYVVHLNNVNVLAAPRPVFSFVHPAPPLSTDAKATTNGQTSRSPLSAETVTASEKADRLRRLTNLYAEVEFEAGDMESVIHGLAGYFDCRLYGDVKLSIVPAMHSANMFSWFPIYFPLRAAVPVRRGEVVRCAFWRINDGAKVWYEWTVLAPQALPIHNPKGRTYTIGL